MPAHRLSWILICVGALLRVSQYLYNRSLWLDEAALALNIVDRSFAGLVKPLSYNQGAPLGFLFFEKAIGLAFGFREYALRLLPLTAGVAALLLLCVVANAILSARAAAVAVGLMAFSSPLIYRSSDVKQYSTDVATAVALYALAVWIVRSDFRRAALIWSSLAGIVLVWCRIRPYSSWVESGLPWARSN